MEKGSWSGTAGAVQQTNKRSSSSSSSRPTIDTPCRLHGLDQTTPNPSKHRQSKIPVRFHAGRIHSGKRNVTVWRLSIPSLCPVGILIVTQQEAACDAASVHFDPTVRRIDIPVLTYAKHSSPDCMVTHSLAGF